MSIPAIPEAGVILVNNDMMVLLKLCWGISGKFLDAFANPKGNLSS